MRRLVGLLLTLFVILLTPKLQAADSVRDSELVEAALLSQLRMGFRSLCEDCRIEFKEVKIPKFAKEDLAELRINFQNLKWNGSFLLPIEFLGQPQAFISGQVRIFRQGLVTKQALASMDAITADITSEEWIDVTFLKDRLVTAKDLNNVVAARGLPIRQALVRSDLRKPELVKRGQSIKIVYGNENFEVTTQMKAEESGAEGDLIKVKALDSAKVFSAKITESGAARIQ